jgi:hypothetical protein
MTVKAFQDFYPDYVEGVATARGEVVAVRMPETFLREQEIHPT